MNDEAREILVAAALDGCRQIRGGLHAPVGPGDCALGVLHLHLHQTRTHAVCCAFLGHYDAVCAQEMDRRFGLSRAERREIVRRNDTLGQDFLTIARKVGTGDAAE